MKALLTAALMLLASTQALAEMAIWTGEMLYVTTVTGKAGVSCKFQASGGTFWMVFGSGMCPSHVNGE